MKQLVLLCLLTACAKAPDGAAPPVALPPVEPAPAVAALAAQAQVGDLPPIAPTAAVSAETAAEPPPPQGLCEVELSGDLASPALQNGYEFIVYVCEGACLQGGRVVQRANARGGPTFFTEVFVPCGTSLGLCASVEPQASVEPAPTALYGTAKGTYLAIGHGEIEFKNVHVIVEPGPLRTFAAPAARQR